MLPFLIAALVIVAAWGWRIYRLIQHYDQRRQILVASVTALAALIIAWLLLGPSTDGEPQPSAVRTPIGNPTSRPDPPPPPKPEQTAREVSVRKPKRCVPFERGKVRLRVSDRRLGPNADDTGTVRVRSTKPGRIKQVIYRLHGKKRTDRKRPFFLRLKAGRLKTKKGRKYGLHTVKVKVIYGGCTKPLTRQARVRRLKPPPPPPPAPAVSAPVRTAPAAPAAPQAPAPAPKPPPPVIKITPIPDSPSTGGSSGPQPDPAPTGGSRPQPDPAPGSGGASAPWDTGD